MLCCVAPGSGTGYISSPQEVRLLGLLSRVEGYTKRRTRDQEEEYTLDGFYYGEGGLRCEDVALAEIAESTGTPTYVYSHGA